MHQSKCIQLKELVLLPCGKASSAVKANASSVEFGATVAFDGGQGWSCFRAYHARGAAKVRRLFRWRVKVARILGVRTIKSAQKEASKWGWWS